MQALPWLFNYHEMQLGYPNSQTDGPFGKVAKCISVTTRINQKVNYTGHVEQTGGITFN